MTATPLSASSRIASRADRMPRGSSPESGSSRTNSSGEPVKADPNSQKAYASEVDRSAYEAEFCEGLTGAAAGQCRKRALAYGVSIVDRINPSFVPWAWAVNGTLTVVGSIFTVIVSMQFGFAVVLVASAAIYLIAFAAIHTTARKAASI